ncbi:MAG: sulfotransferase family 2 domain-containing protein [Desulfuromonadales bacterium]|nr:sulfotransferase family 2 domain-containing protein [Desulfuromonadales bacterium]
MGFAHPESLKVTVLREPIDRIVSHYFFAQRDRNHYLYPKIHEQKLSLAKYVSSGISGELQNWYTTHFSGMNLMELSKEPERALEMAMYNLTSQYDLVGVLEKYEDFIDKLRKISGLKVAYPKRRFNVTHGRPQLDSLDEATIEIIKQFNQLDISLYERIRKSI